MKAINSPIPAEIAALSGAGIEAIILLLNGEIAIIRNKIPEMSTIVALAAMYNPFRGRQNT